MKLVLILISILISLSFAEVIRPKSGCILSQQGDVKVSWEAYKTAAKIGVGGVFKDVVYKAAKKEGKNFREILVGSTIKINTFSIDTNDKERDREIIKSFFELLSSKNILVKVVDIIANKRVKQKPRTGTIIVEITFNNKTRRVPLSYIYDKGVMKGEGYIDLYDFSASKALASLNRACFDKHDGKSWNDVKIGFQMNIKAILCAVKH